MADDIDTLLRHKPIEEMGVDTLRRYALQLQERLQMRDAHNAAMERERLEAQLADVLRREVPKMLEQAREQERKRFDAVKFLRWIIKQSNDELKRLLGD